MHTHFFSHLVDIKSLHFELSKMDFDQEETTYLHGLIEETLQQKIMHLILSELSNEDKKLFLKHVALNDHHATWRFLNKKTRNLEKKIIEAANVLADEMHKDIKTAKTKKT